MNVTTIHNEAKRGCGYRKQGGMYLMAGGTMQPCGKLPLQLDKCPCCGAGIKPARGWTWIDPRPLFKGKPCQYEKDGGGGLCILDDVSLPERVGLLWVGERFYPTPKEFMAEGVKQGLSRRINAIPHGFEIGKTWVLFAHRKGIIRPIPFERLEGQEPGSVEYLPAIFTAFRPTAIEYIVKDDDTSEKLEQLEMRGIKLVRLTWDADHNGNRKLDLEDEPEFPEGGEDDSVQEELFVDENGGD